MRKKFTERIREILDTKGMSIYRLAKEAGLTQGHAQNILTGKRGITEEAVKKIAPVLGIPAEELQAWVDADKLSQQSIDRIGIEWLEQRREELWKQNDQLMQEAEEAKARGDAEALKLILEKQEKLLLPEIQEFSAIEAMVTSESPRPVEHKKNVGKYPLTDWELEVINKAETEDVSWRIEDHQDLLDIPSDERKGIFLELESFLRSIDLHKRLFKKG